ncbi:hexitol phosphatase HxpB [Flavobacterium faecale]|uniref:hexitol phosphatase HxpB n=1 Tax=Flavobacterium faecale TaxID=1355330 RepID=UPI003AAF4890
MKKNTFIFDMDGVIIDSEPHWREAQIKVLARQKISINAEDCIQYTMGKRIDDVAKIWCSLFQLETNPKIIEKEIIDAVVLLIKNKGVAKQGLYELLDYLAKNKYKIALATSSSFPIIDAVFDKLSIRHYFNEVNSADDEEYGKPHPAVYIRVTKKLNINPTDCIVLEDSVTGMIAGKSASMTTLVIPEDPNDPRFSVADQIFSSMTEIIDYLEKNSQ